MAKDIDLSDLLTHHQEQQGAEAKAIVPEKVEREVETAVDTLTPEELAKVEQIKDSIDMTDSEALLTYGAPAQKKIAAFSDSVLAQVRAKDSGEVGQLLGSLVTEVKEYDEKSQGGFLRKVPILVYPTLHYQNGGLEIGGDGFTKAISNLLVAGEAVGGIHGRNRLMGNSLLDIIVFGRNAGKAAAAKAKETELGTLTLKHIEDYAEELKSAGIESEDVSPLLLPHYARHER